VELPDLNQPRSSNRQPAAATGFPIHKKEKKCSGPWFEAPPSRFSMTTTFHQPLVPFLWNPPNDKSNHTVPGRWHHTHDDVRLPDR